ncbi:MAG: peptidoglycan-binding domain-containing protein [Buchananella hordeovulneris]|nr:peptidoglycan-binding domain-containing protein [Buchananella hordeovulneris]
MPESLLTEVTEQTVGRTITLTTTLSRSSAPLAVNELAGTVTEVGALQQVEAGALLYKVDAVQVRALVGSVPFYREIGPGAKGEDVKQLQEFLVTLGCEITTDGDWGIGTTSAVKHWQGETGQEKTGFISAGTLVAIPHSPINLTADNAVLWKGAKLAGGEKVLQASAGTPDFYMELNETQAQMVTPGTAVMVHAPNGDFNGVAGQPDHGESVVKVPVASPAGGLLCGDKCGELGGESKTYLPTEIEIVPKQSGPAVPVSALLTKPDGTVVVVAENGNEVPVTVKAISEGIAVVEGVEIGQLIRVFATSEHPTAERTGTGRQLELSPSAQSDASEQPVPS